MNERKIKIEGLIQALCKNLYEREEVVKLALLSAIAGESIFLLGPPGVGKSLVARRLKHAFKEGKSFEYLMTKFSTPDEVFGPISIQKLKDEDTFERKTDNYLPGAKVVFLDEIWKSSSAIQNALLTILNEKIYRNGEKELSVDIKAIITASNELPPSGESYEPLWDRMLLRYEIGGIKKKYNFLQMITATEDVYDVDIPEHLKITNDELASWNKQINEVEVPEEVLNAIQVIRHKLEELNNSQSTEDSRIKAYDRRWKKIIRLLRTSAFLNGRNYCDLMDVFLIVHCLWNHPSQLDRVMQMVAETIRKHGYSLTINLQSVIKELEAFEKDVNEEIYVQTSTTTEVLKPYKDEYYQLQKVDKRFGGEFIDIKSFNQLQTEEFKIVNFYDEQLNLVNRLDCALSQSSQKIMVKHNSQEHEINLLTHSKEKLTKIFKAPHPIVRSHWDKLFDNLAGYLKDQINYITENKPKEMAELPLNLFIDASLSSLITANLEEVLEKLKQMQLRLEKIKFNYSK